MKSEMRRSVQLLVGCGLLMACEAAVMPSAAPALIPAIRCVCIFDGVLNAFGHAERLRDEVGECMGKENPKSAKRNCH